MSTEEVMAPAANEGPHPVPLASHDDVAKDPTLFMDTLKSFHLSIGSKFTIPVISGKELNLHVLYVEVTRRGGYDKVVSEKKWREISTVFEFSPTTTSASYALRKHYLTLLHRYEMVYFFRHQASMPNLQTTEVPSSFQATGTIDAKFDCGYIVSVKLGNETLNGVLYHPSYPAPPPAAPPAPLTCTDIVPYNPPELSNRRTRTRRRRRSNDPDHPKINRSGYNFYFAEKHALLKVEHPNRERQFTRMIGDAWTALSLEEREVYQNIGLKDKERYQREMKEYREMKMGQS
ncbi:hypothetical protein ABFS82_03G076500 [Erythranthe guttata]|uniref:HMG box domain-containing protein n=1 Tax=Erythranthe guttata TaxID=4155 RepID=A0A022PRV4_ERYGU|nr:PREDICTED: high mobility group B protein 9 [Erythranthe guttata]EYU17548.1 hypothetical protein MIMGU_mgv1a019917mg [Erythranthe guttata]|eukprot:XP_012829636.1 PREDICTED: high mobility group B protein 9 [Erythranthe guttata]